MGGKPQREVNFYGGGVDPVDTMEKSWIFILTIWDFTQADIWNENTSSTSLQSTMISRWIGCCIYVKCTFSVIRIDFGHAVIC